ncbi:hypothetical protein SEA_PAELLA_220 [Arthrobacter phage Paella]|nr:hypothetical protein SEA_PAELLA_220 [Arthrobacter phage Paella]
MTDFDGYPVEELDSEKDNGTIPKNLGIFAKNVVGRRIVEVHEGFTIAVSQAPGEDWDYTENVSGTALGLDDGTRVLLADTHNCCAHTVLKDIILNLDKIEHVITGVGTTDGYTKWHIYANLGDVATLKVGWSCGNPFYYGYGFDIYVVSEEGDIKEVTDEDI